MKVKGCRWERVIQKNSYITESYNLVIPVEWARGNRLHVGDKVVIIETADGLLIKPKD